MQNQQILEDRIVELEWKLLFKNNFRRAEPPAWIQQQFDMDETNSIRLSRRQIKRYAASNIASSYEEHRLHIIKM